MILVLSMNRRVLRVGDKYGIEEGKMVKVMVGNRKLSVVKDLGL